MTLNNISRYGTHYIIKNFAANLFGIFIPIYLYANGFSLVQVGIFYFCQEAINLFFTYVLYKKIHSWGVKDVIILATIFQIILLSVIYNFLTPTYVFLLALSFIRGLHDSFYWGSYEMIMVHLSGNNVGKFLGKWNFVITILQVITIPTSAYILDHFSPFWLIALAIMLLFVSILPLIKIKLSDLENNLALPLKKLIENKDNRYIAVASNLNEFLQKVTDIVIPIYVFIIFKNYLSVGFAETISIIGVAAYSYFVSNKSEESKKRKFFLAMNIGAFLLFMGLLIFTRSNSLIYFIVAILAFFRSGVYLSSTVGMNKLCLHQDCYARKMFGRMSENCAGMLIGILISLYGIFNFQAVFFTVVVYILFASLFMYHFKESV